ncbi:hypothetical protein KDL01_31335 [Actinospica durhamensis]|uniref:DUF4190 domain-containing protein n=1 Tax=Actinospica durhamensis TaxID=1508375 RepID=A0A941IQL9_9ACTN|nr:hypothetical protein [Actinospica durhamensis]MBR7837810.1 hypothetical protein [Actinospica durhamensis]
MASYQNPNQPGGSLPPSSLNWGDSLLDPQDESPYGPGPVNPPVPPPIPPAASASGQVQHAVQPHPFVAPQPYVLGAPPVYDSVPQEPAQALSYGYGAAVYTGPPEPGESGKARAALWIGILGGWLPVNLFVAGAAIAETGPGRKRGRDKAVIGLCCSLVWVVLLGGVAFALRHHTVDPVPAIPREKTASAASDPGCYAGANAVYAYQGSPSGLAAQKTLGSALINAAGKSHVADAPLRKLGLDYLSLAAGAAVPTLAADTDAVSTACGLSFRVN